MAYVNDSDEEQEEEEDMLLACIEKKDPEKDPYWANIWSDVKQIANIAPTSSDESVGVQKDFTTLKYEDESA